MRTQEGSRKTSRIVVLEYWCYLKLTFKPNSRPTKKQVKLRICWFQALYSSFRISCITKTITRNTEVVFIKEKKKQNKPRAFRPTDKNELYLRTLGYMDGRTGNLKNDATRFINECITVVCESHMVRTGAQATEEELFLAWKKHQMAQINRSMIHLQKEAKLLAETGLRVEVKE